MYLFKKIDFLFFGFVGITTILLIFSWNSSDKSLELLLIRGILILVSLGLIYADSKIKLTFVNLLRRCYPIVFSLLFYTETVYYNKLFFNNLDPYLINLESLIFDFQPSVEFSKTFSSLFFSELMYIGYFSLYILIISFIFLAYFNLKKDTDILFFKLAASMLLFYLFFGFFPAAGPQFYFSSPEKDLPTAFLFDKIMHFIQRAEQPTGAFPSSHVGISIIILVLLRKKIPIFFKISVPFVFLLILSTVYIKAHYVVDVFGGILFVPIVLYIASFLYQKIPDSKL